MAKPVRSASGLLALASVAWLALPSVAQAQARQCTPAGSLVPLAGLAEASGLAPSRRTPGRLWTHNDSGQPILFALDSRGAVTGQVQVTGAKVEDWESIEVGPCGSSSCLYIGDIGDNDAARKRITMYRLPEPERLGGTVAVSDVLHATYPDGAHDAETLFFAGDRLHVVTKGDTGPVALYRFPAQLQAGVTMKLERVGAPTAQLDPGSRITDGAASPDGQWRAAATVSLASLSEPQGEGVAFGPDNAVFLAGEGGGKKRPGTFARLSCSAPRS